MSSTRRQQCENVDVSHNTDTSITCLEGTVSD